jgi:hypothetical protein
VSVLHFEMCRKLRKAFEEFNKLDADRVALGRLQKAFGATPPPAKTEPQSPSVLTSVARPTDQGETP